MTLPQPRPAIAAMPRYVPGARQGGGGIPPVKVSSNEVPWGPLPAVAEAIARAGDGANRYPDMFAVEVTERIAERHTMTPSQVVVGGGSVAALAHILQAYTGPGDEVIFAWRSFEAYPILTQVVGATPVMVPLTGQARHDLPAMAAAVTDRTKIAIVCSPNNPTGPSIRLDEFEAFMEAMPESVLVVLDEAYVEFVRDPATVAGRTALDRHPNLLVLRTFSKAYGLAGLRVGYAMGPDELIAPVRACVTPFSVSAVAQAAAIASLAAEAELMERVERVVAERSRVVTELATLGWDVPDAQGNFVWLAAGDGAQPLAATLAGRQPSVLVRPFAGEGVRVSIGSAAENDAVLAALADADQR